MANTKRPLSVILVSAYLLLSLFSISAILSVDYSSLNTVWSTEITKIFNFLSLLVNILVGIGLLLRISISRQIFAYAYPVFILLGMFNSNFQFISVTLFSIAIYIAAVYFLNKDDVNKYFDNLPSAVEPLIESVSQNTTVESSGSLVKQIISLFLLFFSAIFIYVSFLISYLMSSEGSIGAVIVLLILLSVSSLICYFGIKLWDKRKAFVLTGTTILSSGVFSLLVGGIFVELSSSEIMTTQQLDPILLNNMGNGSVIIGILISLIGGLMLYYSKVSDSL